MKKDAIWKQPAGIAVISAALFGLLVHMFGLVTFLHNYDDIGVQPMGYGAGIPSGRWFLQFLGDNAHELDFGFNLSWVNGVAFLALIAVSAGLLASALGVKRNRTAALCGGLMVSFPTVAATLMFNYTAAYYGVALLLAVFAVWVLPKHKLGFLLSIVCIACSLGIYQAYVPVTITLFVIQLLKKLLDEDATIPELFKRGIFDCAILGLGFVVYYAMMKYSLAKAYLELFSYQGISEMGKMSPKELVNLVILAVQNYYQIPVSGAYSLAQTQLLRIGYGVTYGLIALLICLILLMKKKTLLECLAAAALWLVFPVAVNFITVMTPNGWVYTIMVYPFVLIFCLLALLAEWIPDNRRQVKQYAAKLVTIVLAMMLVLNGYWANVNYTAAYFANQKTENYLNSLVTQIRMTPGFDATKEWALLGSINDPLLSQWWDWVPLYGGNTHMAGLINNYTRMAWVRNYFGYDPPIASEETIAALREMPEVQNMPYWPAYGSIAVIGDQVVVKFSD